jgi:Domain of unknown function (DUF4340)
MLNKLSTKTLIILFAILLIIVAAFLFYDSKHGERTFRNEIVSIDTAKVTAINIYPKSTGHKLVKIFKEGNYWKVDIANNKTAYVPDEKVNEMFRELLSIKPLSVAALSKDKWKEYQVDDSSATEVKVYEGGDNTLDISIGKFAFERPRNMLSYVKVGGDDNVYKINGMPGFLFNQDANYFRDGRLIDDNYSNWTELSFTYPGDSSFVLIKKNKNWIAGNIKADSVQTINYFRELSNLSSQNFVDNFNPNILNKSSYLITINSAAKGGISISAYLSAKDTVVNSSTNSQAYFDGNKNGLFKKIFVSKRKFIKGKK